MPRLTIKELDSTEKGVGSDMVLYFVNTYVLVSPDGVSPPKWAKYQGYKSGIGHYFDIGNGKVEIVKSENSKAYIEWTYPTGWYNGKTSAFYCERIPKRQHQKGLSSANFSFTSAEALAREYGMLKVSSKEEDETGGFSAALQCISGQSYPKSVQAVQQMFVDTYPDLSVAYEAIREKSAFCRALSRNFALFPHPQSKDLIVFCHDVPVGELLTKYKLKVMVPEYKPECLSFFSKQGVSVVS